MTPKENTASSSLRYYQGKKLLAYLRGGDYAHAGEDEAIIRVMSKFQKNQFRQILDAGCGLGGTAEYIQGNGWGNVTGIDIEEDAINYAKKNYPHIEFYAGNISDVSKIIHHKKFDLICLFNSFYAFHDQITALNEMFNITISQAKLALLDYSDPLINNPTPLYHEGNQNKNTFKPIKIQKITAILNSTGWYLNELIDVSEDYLRWYSNLLEKIIHHKNTIILKFGKIIYENAFRTYTELYDNIVKKNLGGVIIYAEKIK